MNYKLFFSGIGFLFVAYLIYRFLLKGVKHALESEDGNGPTPSNYVGLWGSVILCLVGGMIFILKSLPTEI